MRCTLQVKIVSYLVAVLVGAGAAYYFMPQQIKIEEKVVTRDVIKTVTKEVVKIQRPDGTIETIEREVVKDEDKKKQASVVKTKPAKKNWGVGVKYDLFRPDSVYTLEVHRRIVSDLYVSAYGRTDSTVGIGVTFFF